MEREEAEDREQTECEWKEERGGKDTRKNRTTDDGRWRRCVRGWGGGGGGRERERER